MEADAAQPARDPRDYRCSDVDRETVAEVIRQALEDGRLTIEEASERLDDVLEAKTYRELEVALQDLPASAVPPQLRLHIPGLHDQPQRPAQRLPDPPRTLATPGDPPDLAPSASTEAGQVSPMARVLASPGNLEPLGATAVLSEFKRSGVWTVPEQSSVVAVLGSAVIDVREAWLADPEPRIQAYAVLGSVEVIVPDDVMVVADGAGVLGEFAGHAEHVPGYPVIRLSGAAILGEVSVKRKRRKGQPKR